MSLLFIPPVNSRFTDSASSSAITSLKRVLWSEFMAIFTMGSFCPTVAGNMAMSLSCQNLQMSWIHAVANAANVVQIKTFWNRAIEQFVDKTVCPKGSIMATQQTVAKFVSARRPQPAFRRWINGNLFSNPRG